MDSEAFTIPAELRQVLFPDPSASISTFLQFTFPLQARTKPGVQTTTQYWSLEAPTIALAHIVELIKTLTIPARSELQQIKRQVYRHYDHGDALSVVYAHLLETDGFLPLWVLTYWLEVSLLCQHVKEPWTHANLWLTKHTNMYSAPEKRQQCQMARALLLELPWTGNTHGFSDSESITRFSQYLSDDWLATVHLNQQLELLQLDLNLSGMDPRCEVVNLEFFIKVLQVYRDHERIAYNGDRRDVRHIWAVGEELAKGIRTRVCGIMNVEESHWVSVGIEVIKRDIWYGDSLGKSNCEIREALEWWIRQHIPKDFYHKNLPITKQLDGHTCSILAVNATGHFCLPGTILLLQPGQAVQERVKFFVRAVKRDLDCVS